MIVEPVYLNLWVRGRAHVGAPLRMTFIDERELL